MRWLPSLLLAALSGGVLALPFTIHDSSLVAWFALAPIFWLVAQSPTKKRAILLSAVFSLVWCGLSFLFLWKLVAAGMIALTIYTSLFYIAGLLAIRRVSRWGPVNAVVATAAIWVFVELARSTIPVFFFPWLLMGHTLVYHDSLRQGADIFGVYGLSAILVSVNAALAFAVPHWLPEKFRATPTAPIRSAWKAVCFACILVFGAQLYGMTMIRRIEPRLVEGAPIGVVQGNIAQKLDRSLDEYERNFIQHMKLHESLLLDGKPKPVLVCWAETMVPGSINTDDWGERFKAFVKNTNVPAFVGANYNVANPKLAGDPFSYNTAYLINADGTEAFHYFKRKLVPFGEYVPFTDSLPFMKLLRSVTRDQYLRGEAPSPVHEVGGYRIAANICVEDIHPDLAREAANNGASLLLNITNARTCRPRCSVRSKFDAPFYASPTLATRS
jgi:apolipoprotein N-acyltransferase